MVRRVEQVEQVEPSVELLIDVRRYPSRVVQVLPVQGSAA